MREETYPHEKLKIIQKNNATKTAVPAHGLSFFDAQDRAEEICR